MPVDVPPPAPTVTRADAAAILRVGVRQVDAWVRAGRLQPADEWPDRLRRDEVDSLAAVREQHRREIEQQLPPSPRFREPDGDSGPPRTD